MRYLYSIHTLLKFYTFNFSQSVKFFGLVWAKSDRCMVLYVFLCDIFIDEMITQKCRTMHLSDFAHTKLKNMTICDKLKVSNFKLGLNRVLIPPPLSSLNYHPFNFEICFYFFFCMKSILLQTIVLRK